MPLDATIEEVAGRYENAVDTLVLHLNKNLELLGIVQDSSITTAILVLVLNTIKNDCFDLFRKIQVYQMTQLNLENDKRLGNTCNIHMGTVLIHK